MQRTFLKSLQQQDYTQTKSFSKMNNMAHRLFKENFDLRLKNRNSVFRNVYDQHKRLLGKEEKEVAIKEKTYVSLQSAVNSQNKGSKVQFIDDLEEGLDRNRSKSKCLKEELNNIMPGIYVGFEQGRGILDLRV